MLSVPAPTRVALGTLQVGGQNVELFISQEWARYFQSLNTQVQANVVNLAESAAHTVLLGEGAEAPEVFPAPPGMPGMQGDAGLALFMLQDDPGEQAMLVPPCVDGTFVPLNSKDAPGGVPGLTQLKLNLKNALGTVTSWFTTAATAARTWTMPDKDGTVAVLSDFAAPPAIGSTTAAAGSFTTVNASDRIVMEKGASYIGPAALSANQISTISYEYPTTRYYIGDGTGYSYVFSRRGSGVTVDVLTITDQGNTAIAGKFSCNGKVPQPPAASGGTLAGVISALVANGILSS